MEYEVRESARAKRLRLSVYPGGEVIVTKPRRVSLKEVARLVESRREWVREAQARLEKRLMDGQRVALPRPKLGSTEHKAAVAAARALITERLAHLNAHYGFAYGRVAIRSQRTLWGSCSRKGNLNFNYKAVHLPLPLVDYLIAHELCHLREMNHSPRFWSLVAETAPDYLERRRELRKLIL